MAPRTTQHDGAGHQRRTQAHSGRGSGGTQATTRGATSAGTAGASVPGLPAAAAVREFNRFYTNLIGVLRAGYLGTRYSLTEARVIFEIAQRRHAAAAANRQAAAAVPFSAGAPRAGGGGSGRITPPAPGDPGTDAAELRRTLDLDAGYLSRILAKFAAGGLIRRERSPADARRQLITLTAAGEAEFRMLDDRAEAQARELVSAVSEQDRRRLVTAMATIRDVVPGARGGEARGRVRSSRRAAVVLRGPLPGELGWVVQRNGAIYAQEYGWDGTYEALVARIVADYAASHDPRVEAVWIAELEGDPVGCVFCVRDSDTVARLRLLLVEPAARGMGIGARLVGECVTFATRCGYAELVLWTNDVLGQARRIYQRAGFRLAESQPHHSFGHDLVGQTWRLPLR